MSNRDDVRASHSAADDLIPAANIERQEERPLVSGLHQTGWRADYSLASEVRQGFTGDCEWNDA